MWIKRASQEDASVNFIKPSSDGGMIETRFVQRTSDTIIVYLSSHNGCHHACRFCHLTATRQTMMTPTSLEEFIDQATVVVGHYEDVVEPIHQVRKVHFNFMARGEPLSNPIVLDKSAELYAGLANLKPALEPKFLISSIIPEDFQGNLSHILSHPGARLYYSLYSMDKDFRRRWLPRAMDPNKALDKIADYQHDGGAEIALHRAFIEGENDSEKQLEDILKAVSDRQIKAKFNLVRYNPYDTRRGREPEEDRLKTLFNIMAGSLTGISSRIVPKVGYDIKASCGMFMLPEELEVL